MSEPITCFNGNECCYNVEEMFCPFFTGNIDNGACLIEPMKGTTGTPAPVAQTTRAPPRKEQTPNPEQRTIASLKEGEKNSKDNPLNLKGTVVFDPEERDVDTNTGPATVTSLVIEDDTGKAKISFWGDKHGQILDFEKGDRVLFEGLFKVKKPYKDTAQVDGGNYYKVVKLN